MTQEHKSTVLEEGNVYFLYRPRAQEEEPETVGGIQRLYMALSPYGRDRYRLLVLGRKRLPEVRDGGESHWGFVDRVAKDPRALREELEEQHYRTKTRGERELPAVRPERKSAQTAAGTGARSFCPQCGRPLFFGTPPS
jgi:hypothetical protein